MGMFSVISYIYIYIYIRTILPIFLFTVVKLPLVFICFKILESLSVLENKFVFITAIFEIYYTSAKTLGENSIF